LPLKLYGLVKDMKNWVLLVGAWGAFGVFTGCGEPDRDPVIDPGTSSKGGKGNIDPNRGGADSEPSAGQSMGGGSGAAAQEFEVAITSPAAADDPVEDDVVAAEEVTVVCEARSGELGKPINPSTVTIDVLDAEGEVAVGFDEQPLSAPGVPTGENDEYSAEFGLASLSSGRISFRCSVKGQDETLSGSTTLDTFLDRGPTIVEKLPEVDSAHPLEGALEVEFTVTPTPLSDDDTEAGVTSVALYVAGVKIDAVTEASDSPGTYRASVDFTDQNLFDEPPTEHTSVRIEATNARSPVIATGVRDYPFVVDGVGPTITFVNSNPRAVFGETVVEFTITDSGAGLDEDTLEVQVSGYANEEGDVGGPVKYEPGDTSVWTAQGNRYGFRFDTGILLDIESQITVNVRALDAAGNLGESLSLPLNLDNVPPWIDLDPGNARTIDTQDYCSASFDPVGNAANDGEIVTNRNKRFRALIYDQTTFGSGGFISYMAGTDQKSARLYIQPVGAEPLLVDRSGDGVCDDLAREDFDYFGLSAVKGAGVPTYSSTDSGTAPAITNQCLTKPHPGQLPKTLCGELSDMTIVVEHDSKVQENEPIIYGLGNLPPAECTGTTWDLGNVVDQDGWICLAARATDNLGNTGLSRPLRICFDDPTVAGSPPCATDNSSPPSCTDNCSVTDRFPATFYSY
jgi:hypothetical protein